MPVARQVTKFKSSWNFFLWRQNGISTVPAEVNIDFKTIKSVLRFFFSLFSDLSAKTTFKTNDLKTAK